MTLDVLKRLEKGSPLTAVEHDNNWGATESEVNAKATTASVAASVASLTTAIDAKATAASVSALTGTVALKADSTTVAALTTTVNGKASSGDSRFTDRRGIATGDYVGIVVDIDGLVSLKTSEVVNAVLDADVTQADLMADVILANQTMVPAVATFADWRDGTSVVKSMVPLTFSGLTTPQSVAYTGTTMTIDFAGAELDAGKMRSLNIRITGITGNLALTITGFTGSLIGQEPCIEFVSSSAGAKTLSIATGAGQTVTSFVGVTSPGVTGSTGRTYCWTRFRSTTEIDVIAWSSTA